MSIEGQLTPAQRVKAIFDEAVGRDLTSWERFEFLPSVAKWPTLSAKQEEKLSAIEERLRGK